MKKTGSIILVFLLTIQLGAQDLRFARLDSFLMLLAEHDRFMGSVAIARDGDVMFSKAVGYADIEDSIPATPKTIYRVGSISKMFTAALTFKAFEDHLLDPDQTIDIYFPELTNASSIKISYLLNHRSGIFSLTNDPDYTSWETTYKSKKDLIDLISGYESVFEPNSKADYSNSNYILLTFILEEAFDQGYASLVRELILQPLELKHTYVGGPADPAKDESYSYYYHDGWDKSPETDMSIPLGAGAIVSTPSDLCHFINGLFNGDIISEESLKKMKTIKDDYGMGLFKFPFHGKTLFGHNGGIDGFTSHVSYYPQDKLSIALTSNGMNYNQNDILIKTLSSYYGIPFDMPKFKEITLETSEMEKFTGEYSSDQLPLKISVFIENNQLKAQATGQASFPLEARDKNIFNYDAAGIVIEFDPENNAMILKQGGGTFNFVMEK